MPKPRAVDASYSQDMMNVLSQQIVQPLASGYRSNTVNTPAWIRAPCAARVSVNVPVRRPHLTAKWSLVTSSRGCRGSFMLQASVGSPVATQPPENVTYIPLDELRGLCSKALNTLGYSTDEIVVLNEVSPPLAESH